MVANYRLEANWRLEDRVFVWEDGTPVSGLVPSRMSGPVTNLVGAAWEMLAALEECLRAEEARRKKLLPGAPATTYCEARLARIRAAIARARGEGTKGRDGSIPP